MEESPLVSLLYVLHTTIIASVLAHIVIIFSENDEEYIETKL